MTRDAGRSARVDEIILGLTVFYVGLIAATLLLRAWRDWHARRFKAIRITYPGNRVVSVPAGFSVLEASRWAGIPHTSVCGGRARCSTCRVRVAADGNLIPAPGPVELDTLHRIGAAPNVRLACQMRPTGDIAVQPIISMARHRASDARRFDAAVEGGRELKIVAMFIDMRGSTRLANGRLPYDALFLFDRYIQTLTGAIRQNGGHVTSIAGDGVMSVFGVDGPVDNAARSALQAALDVWRGLEALNVELASELPEPLRIGIGLHAGVSVIGFIASDQSRALQFLGDTGNLAAKLEARTKDLRCTVLASGVLLDLVMPQAMHLAREEIAIDGREDPIMCCALRHKRELHDILSAKPIT